VAGKVRSGRTSALQVVAFKEDEQQKAAKQAAGDKKVRRIFVTWLAGGHVRALAAGALQSFQINI
jgi:hypothetical protein